MRKSITVLMAGLLAIGMLASFAGPVAAHDYDKGGDGTEAETTNEAELDNNIEQDQNIEQTNEMNAAAVAFYGDAEVEQENEQEAEQEQNAENVNEVAQDAFGGALSFDW